MFIGGRVCPKYALYIAIFCCCYIKLEISEGKIELSEVIDLNCKLRGSISDCILINVLLLYECSFPLLHIL